MQFNLHNVEFIQLRCKGCHYATFIQRLPRDAMLAWYILYRVSVCLSHTGIVSKQLNLGSCKQRHTIVQGL